ncbi:hypothetical protein LJC32_00605 [Oscillospiraceae bacterium OttesenSCG-928-F05]|nr:hypothetical protein [Oscillospiraceae bacterium OttesenSCG-928-F05]
MLNNTLIRPTETPVSPPTGYVERALPDAPVTYTAPAEAPQLPTETAPLAAPEALPNTQASPIAPLASAASPLFDRYTPAPAQRDAAGNPLRSKFDAYDKNGCSTCENRRYVDESDDGSVSFQAPTKVAPQQAASAVAAHEREHVFHEQADARQSGRKVVSQTVSLHYATCPECGQVHVSGGTTRTVTRGEAEDRYQAQQKAQKSDPAALDFQT